MSDVFQRKRSEDSLRQEHAFATAVLDTVGALIVVLDKTGRIIRFNQACESTTGYSLEDVQGTFVWDSLIPADQVAEVKAVFSELTGGQFPNTHENYWLTKEGGRRLIAWTNTALVDADGSVEYVIGTGLDVTELRRAEAALVDSRDTLRNLSARLTSVHEELLQYLAHELHDGIGQSLAVLAIQVAMLRDDRLTREERQVKVQAIEQQIGRMAADLRNVSHQLHPTVLQHLGLPAALKRECQGFLQAGSVSVDCQMDGLPESIPHDTQLALYRIVQEALHNVAKHARASTVVVAVDATDDQLSLSVRDDGRGFNPAEIRQGEGLGLASMEERARAIGGSFTVQSQPGDGTSIEVSVPIERQPC